MSINEFLETIREYDEVIPLTVAYFFGRLLWRLFGISNPSPDDPEREKRLEEQEQALQMREQAFLAREREFAKNIEAWRAAIADAERRAALSEEKATKRAKELTGARQRFERKLKQKKKNKG